MCAKLVILTTHFGTNFSGGSTATCEIFIRLEKHFDDIIIFGTEIGQHSFNSLHFKQYHNSQELRSLISKYNSNKTKFYGDFYNAVAFAAEQVPFYFTYHDNWPELADTSFDHWVDGFKYMRAYEKIFNSAQHVFTVSEFKRKQIAKYTSEVSLVRNGFHKTHELEGGLPTNRQNILMVGNIDDRKYQKALELFNQWNPECKVDIYGRVIDKDLADGLDSFPCVSIKGFVEEVPYHQYRLLLHTSLMENLPITFCEAIYSKTPVVAFDVGGCEEVITSDTGVLIEPYDLEELKKQVIYAYNSYEQFNLKSNILSEFDWERAAIAYQKIILN